MELGECRRENKWAILRLNCTQSRRQPTVPSPSGHQAMPAGLVRESGESSEAADLHVFLGRGTVPTRKLQVYLTLHAFKPPTSPGPVLSQIRDVDSLEARIRISEARQPSGQSFEPQTW